MVFRLKESITNKQKRFCSLEQSSKSSKNILHIMNLFSVPTNKKQIIKNYCVKTEKNLERIIFINA